MVVATSIDKTLRKAARLVWKCHEKGQMPRKELISGTDGFNRLIKLGAGLTQEH